MRRPSFMVTAGTVVVLSLIGAFRVLYEPLLPASPTEYLVTIPKYTSVPAPIVEIDWKRSISEGQEEAKRRKLGMLIFFVDPSNYYAKQLELDAFRDPEVARFVNRNLVAIKINLDDKPEWSQAVLPLQRLFRFIEPGIDLVMTDSSGQLVDHFVVENPFQYSGPELIVPFMVSGLEKMRAAKPGITLQDEQEKDLSFLSSSALEPLPDFDRFHELLKSEFKLRSPGVFVGDITKFRPMALRYLAKTGELQFAGNVARELGKSPLYDALDGGFFREARTTSTISIVDTSKTSSYNALNATVLAQLACSLQDDGLMAMARDTGNSVITEFTQSNAVFSSRLNDQDPALTSRRSSLTEGRLANWLDTKQFKSLEPFLDIDRNKVQKLAAIRDLGFLENPDFLKLREIIKEKSEAAPGLSEPDQVAVMAYVAARLFDLYRFTNDVRYLNQARSIADQTYESMSTDFIYRTYGSPERGEGWLGTYLAVADCGLANYAATGEIYPLRNGESALKMAIQKFQDPSIDLLVNVERNQQTSFRFLPTFPDVADKGRESWSALALRLAYHYSINSESSGDQAKFLALAQSMMIRLNSAMNKASSAGAGFFEAAYDTVQNQAVLVSGPNRVSDANRLAKVIPFIPVYPKTSIGGDKKATFYLRHGTQVLGPMSETEVLTRIRKPGFVQGR